MILVILFLTYMTNGHMHYSHQYDSPNGKKTCVADFVVECHDK